MRNVLENRVLRSSKTILQATALQKAATETGFVHQSGHAHIDGEKNIDVVCLCAAVRLSGF